MSSKTKSATSERIADKITSVVGSLPFVIIQSVLLLVWVVVNSIAWFSHYDPYPFILMNLMLSLQAAYTGPFVLISQNRQAASDRRLAQQDYVNNLQSKHELDAVLARIEQLADHLAEQDALILQSVSKPARRSKAALQESHLHIVEPTESGGEVRDE